MPQTISAISDTLRLNTGVNIPGYGFGCYKITDPAQVIRAVLAAVSCGYRYLDTAAFYHNEDAVGEAVRRCGLPRNELFVLSKIWPTHFDQPVQALQQSLRLLGLDTLDGYLLHWPGIVRDVRMRAFEQLLREQKRGVVRVLGVSNFLEPHLQELHDEFGVWPALNQIEIHPAFPQTTLCEFCAQRGIQVISWAPLGRGKALEHPVVAKLAATLRRTPSQILLRWHLERGLLPIPKSAGPERIAENSKVFDFRLNPEHMAALDALSLPDSTGRTGADPMTFAG